MTESVWRLNQLFHGKKHIQSLSMIINVHWGVEVSVDVYSKFDG